MKITGSYIAVFTLFLTIQMSGQSIFNEKTISKIKIHNEKEVNSANLESSPAFFGDKIAFVTTGIKGKIFDKDIDEPYFDLAYASVNPDNSLGIRTMFDKKVNSDYHEGPMTYDPLLNKLYFTRSSKESGKIKDGKADSVYLRIMSLNLNQSKPTEVSVNINVDNYNICHPSLSKDGKTMVFSSNKPGGNGKMDLYTAYFDGIEWTGVINVGNELNTSSNELFPFLFNDTLLVFSSDRLGGYGGLDMYVAVLKDGIWTSGQLLPKPLNSPHDDLGMVFRSDGKSGYFTSNRPGGKGKDDIYSFSSEKNIFSNEIVSFEPISLTVLDKLTLEPLPSASVKLTPLDIDINNFALSAYNIDMLNGNDPGDLILKLTPKKGKPFAAAITDSLGRVDFTVIKIKKYLITATLPGYNEALLIYDYSIFGTNFNIVLEPAETNAVSDSIGQTQEIKVDEILNSVIIPKEAGSKVIFENIYYDYNSTNIIPGAAHELDLLATTMLQNPNMIVRLEAHTDSRGTSDYNLQLSINRAEAARKYIINLGVATDRINIKGFGESRLRNECKDHIPCTELKHRYNRRTEVVIEQ
ncbi:MAG: OmpA family protein [Saprospiraceae bacterium]|nr:OmpA family protein [Saprospiraceae bacterium]